MECIRFVSGEQEEIKKTKGGLFKINNATRIVVEAGMKVYLDL